MGIINFLIRPKVIIILVILFVLAGLSVSTVYFYQEYQKVKRNPELIVKAEIESVTNDIRRFMDLPTDEEPTLATVTDKDKLSDQDFFKNAQNGDKVLIYVKAQKAILYRPSTKRVIEFAPLFLHASDENQSNNKQPNVISVAIYNGTKTPGVTADYEKKLTGIKNILVTNKSNASNDNYTKTLVVDISGKNKEILNQISNLVNGEVIEKIPTGEKEPQADVLIIVGNQQ
ncbi:MAG: LytR C-terminal domain-containing protein [Patescibacteria group bacterium]|nr:LytR C-terminal domain-containing protein [Patescibacteria group bacterium]